MSKKEAFWFCLTLTASALTGIERGWKAVCWNIGITIYGWALGHIFREASARKNQQ